MIEKIIHKYKEKLLDLSKRNKLLNIKLEGSRTTHVNVVDQSHEQLLKNLTEGENIVINSLPKRNNFEKLDDENTDKFIKALKEAKTTDKDFINEIKKLEEKIKCEDIDEIDVQEEKIKIEYGLSNKNKKSF